MNIKHVNTKQTKQFLALLIIAATLISACGIAPEAVISPLAAQAAALLAPAAAPTQAYTVQPTATPPAPAAAPTQPYTVQPGDTLSGIAVTFRTTVDNVITLNAGAYPQMADRRTLVAGWTIQVPMGAGIPNAEAIAANGSAAVAAVTSEPTAVAPQAVVAPAQPTAAGPVRDASGGYFDYDAALEIIRLTNEARAQAGLGPLEIDEGLMEIARKRAVEIVSDWGHQGLADDCGECGENIAGGSLNSSAAWFVSRWMNSEGHRNNILDAGATLIGVGIYAWGNKLSLNRTSNAVQDFK